MDKKCVCVSVQSNRGIYISTFHQKGKLCYPSPSPPPPPTDTAIAIFDGRSQNADLHGPVTDPVSPNYRHLQKFSHLTHHGPLCRPVA